MTSSSMELVFVPCPAIGHLVSAVELAKLLVGRDEGLTATVLFMRLGSESALAAMAESLSAACTSSSSSAARVRLIELPRAELQSDSASKHFFNFLRAVEGYKPHVHEVVRELSERPNHGSSSPRLAGLMVDMFCTSMIDVANEFGLPSYVFFTCSAHYLGLMFHLKALRDDRPEEYAKLEIDVDSDSVIADYPGLANPCPVKFLSRSLIGKDRSPVFLDITRRFGETRGILVNTFEELENRAVEFMSGSDFPPVYPVGPVLSLRGEVGNPESVGTIKWLDDQPAKSVVFLCFGSMGSLRGEQVKQIAHALERSCHRFLWSLRPPPPAGKFDFFLNYDDPEEVLPEGFMDRTARIGRVIGWAPQAEVLAHPAIGGFVSHCGWNSILESIWFGVPVAAWPMYAEQHVNAFELAVELGMAVVVRMDYRRDFSGGDEVVVMAEEIESGIRRLMEGREGEGVREKVRVMSERSRRASTEGGSSYSNLGRFIKDVRSKAT